ncbi:D-alanyl-D-alanine carboxypeptidase-like protein [Kribbella rubisoli]|uniref:D-alanyl-D-alanine carboxypeptidase-like protein n=1 Tax=Kribbella rubisoli TaxID=3075929 RepID=A0A4Q7WX86_9ACTN|nr:M15 family metallopeptidase [Kribbella rubisoli]RZU14029.1 D-alanyl-D-alanine carboxypeptidase-like protein [Kribbella rubisoli]
MRNDLPPRRPGAVRTRLLSVIGVVGVGAVAGSLLLWHAQVGDFLGLAADKEPVVSTVSAPAIGAPPASTPSTSTPTPTRRPTYPPTTPPKTPSTSPTKRKTTEPTTTAVREESINGLSPKLKARLKKAMAAARADGITISITSARRSASKQQRLLNAAIKKYGSYKVATRWVLPPKYSAHVQGKAVDIGPAAAMTWLNKNGWRYGVCRRYDNEPWHFEALTAPGTKCPPREPHAVAKAD